MWFYFFKFKAGDFDAVANGENICAVALYDYQAGMYTHTNMSRDCCAKNMTFIIMR